MPAKPLMLLCQDIKKKKKRSSGNLVFSGELLQALHTSKCPNFMAPSASTLATFQYNPAQSLHSHCPRQHTVLMWNERLSPSQVLLLKDWGWVTLPLKGFGPQELLYYWKCTCRPSTLHWSVAVGIKLGLASTCQGMQRAKKAGMCKDLTHTHPLLRGQSTALLTVSTDLAQRQCPKEKVWLYSQTPL